MYNQVEKNQEERMIFVNHPWQPSGTLKMAMLNR